MSYFYQYVKFKSDETFSLPDGSTLNYFVMCTQQPDLGYGYNGDTKILNKDLSIGDIRYKINASGLQQVQNTSISFSNVGQFYHAMRELNGDDFWSTLNICIYWANGRVPTLAFDGVDWKEDGETIVSFTPTIPYPLTTDYIKKEFEGSMASASIRKDKVSLSLVSKSKQDSYLVGSIQSFNGADSSRSLISPILIGNLTDENAYVPLILKNPISSKSTGICSDIPLSSAPIPYIYDDENEKFHEVINDQKATNNNKQIEFYNEDESESFDTDLDFVKTTKTGDLSEGPIYYTLTTGEVVGYFTDSKNFVVFEDYADAEQYHITSTTDRLRDEGTRDNNNDGIYEDGTETGFLVDANMAIGIAKLKLSLYPISIKTTDPQGDDIPTPSDTGYLGFTQDPDGPDDFKTFNFVTLTQPSYFGSLKNFINYRLNGSNPFRVEPTYEDDTSALWVAGEGKGGLGRILSTDWINYNYNNKVRSAITADFEEFKYDSDIIDLDFKFNGGVYKNFETSDDPNAYTMTVPSGTPARSLISLSYKSLITGFYVSEIIHDDNSLTGEFNYNTVQDISYSKLSDLYENPPLVTFNGFTTYNPVKSTSVTQDPPIPADCYLDRADPSFYGSSRFAIDGIRVDAEVNAKVESKYWCFKGTTGANQTLNDGLNTLATRYDSTAFTSGDTSRDSWLIAGAHTGNPIYYRDLLAKIADEFRVFITDKNAGSEVVSMGLTSVADYTIDESNIFTPWNSNISFGETEATEIYNKIVIRYAKNHMTKRYGKTVSATADLIERTATVDIFEDATEIQSYLQIAKDTLAKINITEKTKTIDLDWVRDDYTANQILKWWAKNSNKQRAKITAEVSKIQFIDAKIGDVINLDLPSLPEFYQVNYQIKQIVNKTNKKISIEAEQMESLERGAIELGRIEQSEISMMTVDDSNGQRTFQLTAYDTEGVDVTNLVNWSSSDSSVSVGMNGLLTAVSDGSAVITAQSGGIIRTCDVWSYATIPSVSTLKTLRGGYGQNDGQWPPIGAMNPQPNALDVTNEVKSARIIMDTTNVPNGSATSISAFRIGGINNGGFSLILNESGGNQLGVFRYNNTSYVGKYFGSYTPTNAYDIDFTIQNFETNDFILNGSPTSPTSSDTVSSGTSSNQAMRFYSWFGQKVIEVYSDQNRTASELLTPSNCTHYRSAKDYIRYSDISGVRENFIKISNRGTAGDQYFVSGEVQPYWFDGI